MDENICNRSRVPRLSLGDRCFGKDITNLRSKSSQTMRIKCAQPPHNPQLLPIYVKEIYSHCRNQDKALDPAYIEGQGEINYKMRAILIDWLVDVHLRFNLNTETLFLTVHLIDAYLSRKSISRNKLQLLGVASLFIASKYCEIYPPQLQYYSDVTDRTYNKQEVLDMESKILIEMNFELVVTSPYNFYERYQSVAELDEKSYWIGRYILELILPDLRFIKYQPSLQAASVVYLVQKICKKQTSWNESLQTNCEYNEQDIRPVAKEMCQLLCTAQTMQLQAVQRKFSQQKCLEVSKIQIQIK